MHDIPRKQETSYSTNSANAMIHLYRAEVGRMTAYRQRLDTTTNWAVVTTAGLTSFALGNDQVNHTVFIFAMCMNYFFLHLEARRFRTFEIAHHRVRIIERFFYPVMLGDTVDGSWHQVMLAELAKPQSPITRNESKGWRLRRNYLWIYLAVLTAWLTKLDSLRIAGHDYSWPDRMALAGIGYIPGWVVLGLVLLFYVYLIDLILKANRTYPLEAD